MRNFLFLLFFSLTFPLFALRSGDRSLPLTGIKWLVGRPLTLTFPAPEAGQRVHRAVVFLLTHSSNAPETLQILNGLSERYGKRFQVAVITPDPETDARNFLNRFPLKGISFGVDAQRQLTGKYMGGSMLYPMAFVTDYRGEILWNGEVVDLPELLEEAEKAPIDADKQEKLSKMLDELQVMMRDNNNRKMRHLTDRIFRLDPGNAAALRMRLFVLENSGRIPEAWLTIRSQLAAVPGKTRLYYTAVDLIARYPYLSRELPGVIAQFMKNVSDPDACDFLTYTLLNRFPFDTAALSGAIRLYERSCMLAKTLRRTPAASAGHTGAGALLASRLGNFPKALELQRQTIKFWEQAQNRGAASAAEKIAEYFELCAKSQVKW